MSLFNTVVKPHEFAKNLLFALKWGQSLDKDKTYPLMGRMRYVWMSDDYTQIKLLLKEGPTSWSDNQEAIMEQIKRHENFISVEEWERDPVYIIATFSVPTDFNFSFIDEETSTLISMFMKNIKLIDENFVEKGEYSITKHPFEIFDEQMALMDTLPKGVFPSKEIADLSQKLGEVFKNIQNEDSQTKETKDPI